MKKIIAFILLIVLSASLGCKLFETPIKTYENSLTLSMNEDYLPYFPYELPTFTLEFDGLINTTENRTGPYEVIFTQNDDFVVSELLSKLFEEYRQKNAFYTYQLSVENEAETWLNTYENDEVEQKYIKVLDNKIYNEIAYLTLDNGLILSINYAKIIDWDNNVYYRWQKTEAIRMILHYPLMVSENESLETIFLLLPIPAGITISFDTTTKTLETILSKEKFKTDKSYYTYEYVNLWNKDKVRDYYINNFNGIENDGILIIEYFDYEFKVTLNEDDFILEHYK